VSRAPDYPAAIVGWRSWSLVVADDALRLCSPSFTTIWRPGCETVAACKQRSWTGRVHESFQGHRAPDEICACGIYASRSPRPAAAFLIDAELAQRRRRSLCSLLGRVRLWGQVVEAEDGWRGERAYPDALYLLEESEHPLAPGHEGLSTDEILAALEPYGVPLELVPAGSLLDLAGRAA
jgi:hypothetical protein